MAFHTVRIFCTDCATNLMFKYGTYYSYQSNNAKNIEGHAGGAIELSVLEYIIHIKLFENYPFINEEQGNGNKSVNNNVCPRIQSL